MSPANNADVRDEDLVSGFGTVDEKGRVSLPKSVRSRLGIEPGTHVAYLVLDGAVFILPQDEHLARLMGQAEKALSTTGLTVQDLLDELPVARAAVVSETYGAKFIEEIEHLLAEEKLASKNK